MNNTNTTALPRSNVARAAALCAPEFRKCDAYPTMKAAYKRAAHVLRFELRAMGM